MTELSSPCTRLQLERELLKRLEEHKEDILSVGPNLAELEDANKIRARRVATAIRQVIPNQNYKLAECLVDDATLDYPNSIRVVREGDYGAFGLIRACLFERLKHVATEWMCAQSIVEEYYNGG